jgi:YidC/Oxa1 family membrane protein insertase
VNKNTILAILLILITVTLFNSQNYNKFFYENIYPRKPYIVKQEKSINENEKIDTSNSNITEPIDTTKKFIQENKIDTSSAISKTDTIWIETDKMIIGIQKKGSVIVSAKMKTFKYYENKTNERKKGEIIDILPQGNNLGSTLKINGKNYDDVEFKYEGEKYIKIENNNEKKIIFSTKEGEKIFEKEYVFKNGTYKVGLNIKNNLNGKKIEIGWDGGIEESEKGKPMQPEIRTAHYSDGKNSQHIQLKKEESDTITGNYKWVGITSKYFFISIVNDSAKDADIVIKSFHQKNELLNKKDNAINYSISYSAIAENKDEKFWFYIGPNDYQELTKYNLSFEQNLFPVFGWTKAFFADKWFPPLAQGVLWLLLKLYDLVKDYGIAILLLAFLTKLVTYPLTYSSTKSMNRMKDIQPKIQQMRDKYKNNPKKMNEELMNLYRKEGVNPLNPGCLPMFLQMPIFIALFVVLNKAIELRGAQTLIIPWIHDLSKPEVLLQLPWNIPMYGSNFALLPIIMAILTYFQNKMTIKDPNQKAMIYFMPVFMLVLFNSFSAGLVLYWTFSSALAIVQQIIIDKQTKKIG